MVYKGLLDPTRGTRVVSYDGSWCNMVASPKCVCECVCMCVLLRVLSPAPGALLARLTVPA